MGKAQSDTATAGWGLGVLGTQGDSCPRSHSLWAQRDLRDFPVFFIVCLPCLCDSVTARSQAQQNPTQRECRLRETLEGGLW